MVVRGATVPDILTAAALRRSLFDASSIAYSDSASGRYVSETLFKRLDVEEASINAPMIEETPVAEIVAAREVALGFQEISEILPVAGVQLVGRLPDELEKITSYAAAVTTDCSHPDLARSVVEFLASPSVTPLIEAEGLMAPFRNT